MTGAVKRDSLGPASLYAASNSAGRETEISYRENKRFVCGSGNQCDKVGQASAYRIVLPDGLEANPIS